METTSNITEQLQHIIEHENESIRTYVAQEALDQDDATLFFRDLLNHGCISGMVGSLIYYRDTHAFFDCYYEEIEELREDYEDNCGMPLEIKGDLKNFLAWFAFEETAYRMANELGIDW